MSGWGLAKGKVVCNSFDEAEEVERALDNRKEMKYVSIRASKPYYNSNYTISWYKFSE